MSNNLYYEVINRYKNYFKEKDISIIEEYEDEYEYSPIIIFDESDIEAGSLIHIHIYSYRENIVIIVYRYSSTKNDGNHNKLILRSSAIELTFYFYSEDKDSFDSIADESFNQFEKLLETFENNKIYKENKNDFQL